VKTFDDYRKETLMDRKEMLASQLQNIICRAYFKRKADCSASKEELKSYKGLLEEWVASLRERLEGMYDLRDYNFYDVHNWRNISAVVTYLANYEKVDPPPYAHVSSLSSLLQGLS